MNTEKRILSVWIFLLACFTLSAQNNLSIGTIFDEYGKKEGSILIELGKDVLGNRTQIKRYKSLVIPSDTAMSRITREAIANDVKDGQKLFESRKDGKTESVSYCLRKDTGTPEYEYILFADKSRQMTLIYVRGNFHPEALEKELHKLKDLFIQVNNKQIKL